MNTSEQGISQYLNQLINPSYDSEPFKARTEQRNRLANRSFESNLMNPLASRGLTRGSNVASMSNAFGRTLADLETDAMANEDTRVSQILNNLLSTYQLPYNLMSGLQSQAMGTLNQQLQANQQRDANRSNLIGAGIGGIGNLIGGMF